MSSPYSEFASHVATQIAAEIAGKVNTPVTITVTSTLTVIVTPSADQTPAKPAEVAPLQIATKKKNTCRDANCNKCGTFYLSQNPQVKFCKSHKPSPEYKSHKQYCEQAFFPLLQSMSAGEEGSKKTYTEGAGAKAGGRCDPDEEKCQKKIKKCSVSSKCRHNGCEITGGFYLAGASKQKYCKEHRPDHDLYKSYLNHKKDNEK